MSGVMIKTGIYGIVRALTFLGTPPEWWGWLLIGIGITSGVLGVLFALAQHDLKRLLAYHSVENIGIIALGLGAGVLGVALNEPGVAVLGFAGALLHVVNHAVFKGLLFLGAGAVIHGTGTGELDRQGGLMKRIPVTAVTFLVGAIAISGLPPLNGFVSEFLIFLGAFEEETLSGASGAFPALAVIGSLALIGGLAAACFTKAFGIVFLGEPRTDAARDARETGWLMRIPLIVLAACCLLIALFAHPIVQSLEPVLQTVTGKSADVIKTHLDAALSPLSSVVTAVVAVLVLTIVLAIVRRSLLAGRDVSESPTWDCGFARPTTRMQYTASSFAQPLTDFFAPFLKTQKHITAPDGLFPKNASLETHTSDTAMERLYRPLFRFVGWSVSRLSWIQHGRVNLYVMYIAATLLILLIWFLGVSAS
jgi:formate hydrogenlyase subunit 3/multisubunit Na+/H+ antiporter MnhD subunit